MCDFKHMVIVERGGTKTQFLLGKEVFNSVIAGTKGEVLPSGLTYKTDDELSIGVIKHYISKGYHIYKLVNSTKELS